ncbi:MAG TPA: hypothetical protein PLV83_05830, partial [Bacilli bacterium]|nr:hypothetical protein [Bacilli bacterium]
MKLYKKILNIIVIALILVTNFLPATMMNASAEDAEPTSTNTVNMDKWFKLYMYYADDRIALGSYDTYEEAKAIMNTIKSTASKTAAIVAGEQVIDAAYAIVHMDEPYGKGRVSNGDHVLNIYASASDAYYGSNPITYVAGTWGVDAAFLEYSAGYAAYKIKISGVTGWIKFAEVTVVPTATYYGATRLYSDNRARVKITATDNIIVRSGAGTKYEQICSGCTAIYNSTYEYYPSKTVTDGEYTWYYIKYNVSKNGYIASKNANWVVELNTLLTDTFYFSNNNILYHHIHMGSKYYDENIKLGTAPFYYSSQSTKTYYLTPNNIGVSTYTEGKLIGTRYLSFDGNYFYNDYTDMIDDYRNNTYDKALNKSNPHYSYFMYLPSHAKTNMTAEVIDQTIRNSGKTSALTHEASYYYNSNGSVNYSIGTESNLYGMGTDLIAIADKFTVSPLSILAAAYRESSIGTSAIAVLKNNLFGYGASDSNPLGNAVTYPRPQDSIYSYAEVVGGNSDYTNISRSYYNGTHKGNKGSGTVVKYMSDPYGGESDTATIFEMDNATGSVENYANTLGIKNNNNVISVYAEPNSQSRIIYTTRNGATGRTLTNIPFIVFDKVSTYENGKYQGYYKVYTDITLNSERVVDASVLYNFDNCYG